MNREQLEANLAHWEQVRRDARKQLEYARMQYKLCQAKLAEIAFKETIEISDSV